MAPKINLHKNKGKVKSIPKPGPSNTLENNEDTSPPALDVETFETELTWSIQQLENTLKIENLDERRAKEATKAMKVLMNNNAPLVKKRQVMRMTFGDYKTKMKKEEEKFQKKCRNFKLVPGKPSEKSKFIKKAKSSTAQKISSIEGTEEEKNVEKNTKENGDSCTEKQFHFEKSKNTFRFNFSVGEDICTA